MSDQIPYVGLMNRLIHPLGADLAQAQIANLSLSTQSNMLGVAALGQTGFQDKKNRRKRRRRLTRPTDTRNIISLDEMDTIWRMTRTAKTVSDGLVDFDDAERNKLLEYAILQYYLGYDEGKYNVLYQDGQLTVLEVTRDASGSKTQGNELGGGITLGKDPSISLEEKQSNSRTNNSGESLRATLDQTKRNEMIATANKLTDMRQQLIRLMDNKTRTVLAPKPKGIHKSKIGQVYIHIDEIGQWTRIIARKEGDYAATSANPQ